MSFRKLSPNEARIVKLELRMMNTERRIAKAMAQAARAEQAIYTARTPAGSGLGGGLDYAFGRIGGTAIPAISGTTVSSGAVTLYTFTVNGATATRGTGTTAVTAFNPAGAIAPANTDCELVKIGGAWFITNWFCP